MQVDQKIDELLSNFHRDHEDVSFDDDYQAIFADEGYRKTNYIVDDILAREAKGQLVSRQLCYLSIGGADGTEAASVMEKTGILNGIVVEISDAAATSARTLSDDLAGRGMRLRVFQGDATQRLEDVLSYARSLREECGITGIVLSAQAVLHELPRRSPEFDMLTFLGRVFKGFDDCLLYAREPIDPLSWPDEVRLSVGDTDSDRLAALATLIQNYLRFPDTSVAALAGGQILAPRDLAVELLHKLLRSKSSSEFNYEMGERLTTINAQSFQRLVESILGQGSCNFEPLVTAGFEDAYQQHNVKAFDREGTPLPVPQTHARFIAFNNKKKA